MKDVAAFVLAGGRVQEMGVLTHRRAKAALPIAGHYRIIDFAMSNLARAGVNRVGVLSQYRPSSLMDHVRLGAPWGLIGRGREVRILSPFQAENAVDWYLGTADAVSQNLSFLKDEKWVMVVSGDHIYEMDYQWLFKQHMDADADLTMVFKRFPQGDCQRFGNVRVGQDNRILEYAEKPEEPLSDLGSLTIYLFKREALERTLKKSVREQPDRHQLVDTVIPELVRKGQVQAAIFKDYWAYARDVDDYYATSMDLLDPSADFDPGKWDIQTNAEQSGIGDVPPAWIGRQADITNSLISPGARVFGSVRRSVLSPGVIVEEGATVVDSVLFHGVKVAAGACLNRVVADKHVRFEKGATVGHCKGALSNRLAPGCQAGGVTVLGRQVHILADVAVGANCQIAPETTVPERTVVPDGENLS